MTWEPLAFSDTMRKRSLICGAVCIETKRHHTKVSCTRLVFGLPFACKLMVASFMVGNCSSFVCCCLSSTLALASFNKCTAPEFATNAPPRAGQSGVPHRLSLQSGSCHGTGCADVLRGNLQILDIGWFIEKVLTSVGSS